MNLRVFIVCLSTLFIHTKAFADYNSNIRGELEGVYVYTDHDAIYFRFKTQPTSHETCKATYFVISGSVPQDRRDQLLSRLMLALASKEQVNIGYDSQGNCANGYIRVHRVG